MRSLSRGPEGALAALLFALFLVVGALPASAAEFRILLDLDNDTATGCSVTTVDGAFDGVEQILVTTVQLTGGASAEVSNVERRECINEATDTFGALIAVDANGWPVGVGNGVNGSNVIETYFPLSAAADPDPLSVHLAVVGSDQGGAEDALLTTDGSEPPGPPIILLLASIVEIPTLSPWGLLALGALLSAAALVVLRRRRSAVAVLVALVLLGGAGLAWAACLLDGQVVDWGNAAPLATDAQADGPPGADLVALFARSDTSVTSMAGGTLDEPVICFRIDSFLIFNQPPAAQDDAFVTDEEVAVGGNVLADNGNGVDSDPDMDPLTVDTTPVSGPANGLLTLNADGTFLYTPDVDFAGVDSFTYAVSDPLGAMDTAVVTLTVNGINDPPVKSGTVNAAGFVEDGGAVAVFASVSVSDVDDTNLESATITLTNRPDGALESLAVSTGGTSIVASAYNPMTGVISLSGTDTLANYQAVIASLLYDNTSDSPDTTDRTISCVVNDGDADSNLVSVMLTVAAANDPPVKSGTVNAAGWVEGGGPVNVYSSVSITDPDDVNLESGTITLTNRPDGALESLAVNTGGTSIVASVYDPMTGVISLSGTDTVANYQAVIASLQYDNADLDADETPRTITCVVNDGTADSNTVSVMLAVDEINTPPMLTNPVINYNAVGNTLLRVDGPDADNHDVPLPGRVASTTNATDAFMAAGPSDPDTPAAMLGYVPGPFPTMLGGLVTIDDDGDFFYVPPVGVEGMDTVMLTFTDGEGGNVPVTLNLTIAGMVWYVEDTVDGSKNPTAGGPGHSLDAFETLAAAEAASGPNHYILVFETDAPLDETITLKSGQKLYGQPVEDAVPALLPGGLILEEIADTNARPVIDRSAGDAVRVVANAGNGDRSGVEIRHLDITGDDNAIDVSAADANNLDIAITDNVLASTNGASLMVDGSGSTGTTVVRELSGTDVTTAGAGGGQIFESVTFDADVVTAGIQPVAGGDVNVGNPGSPGDVVGHGVRLNNVRGTLDYGTLNIGNSGGVGLFVRDADGKAGTFVLDTDGGAINTVNGPAVDLDPVGLGLGGMDGMVLTSVTANVTAGVVPHGINLHTVAGSFQVTGATSISASGAGTLTTGISATNATAAITFTGATTISNTAGVGIGMSNVDGDFTVASTMSNITGAAGAAIDIDQGLGNFTYNGSIMNTAGRSVEITNHEGPGGGSTVSLTGSITDSGIGIFLDNNDQGAGGSVINLTGALNLTTGGSTAFSAINGGVVNVTDPANNNLIATTTGVGVTITNTAIGASGVKFTTVNVGDANPAAPNAQYGILLTNAGGNPFTATGGAIQNVTARGVDVLGGTGNVTVGASISTTATGRSLEVTGHTGGTVAVSGTLDDDGLGVNLDSNTGGTINITGSMDIDTVGANNGFNATGGGTVNVMTGVNDVNTSLGTGMAVNIVNTTIGANGVTFRSASADGAPVGILLDNAGTSGFFTVTGTGSTAGSGGLIQNTTQNGAFIRGTDNISLSNMNFASASNDGGGAGSCSATVFTGCNAAVELETVTNVDLVNLAITGAEDHGIFGQMVTDLDISNTNITGLGADVDTNEHGIFIRDLLGTVAGTTDSVFDGVTVSDAQDTAILIQNVIATSPGNPMSPDQLTVSNSMLTNAGDSGLNVQTVALPGNLRLVATGNTVTNTVDGIDAEASAGNLQATVGGAGPLANTISAGAGGDLVNGILFFASAAIGDATVDATATGNIVALDAVKVGMPPVAPVSGLNGIGVSAGGASVAHLGTIRANVQGNMINSSFSGVLTQTVHGVIVTNEGTGTTSQNVVTIDGNTIILDPPPGTTTAETVGIGVDGGITGVGTTVRSTNNTILATGDASNGASVGIQILPTELGDPAGTGTRVCVRVTGNDVSTPNNPFAAAFLTTELDVIAAPVVTGSFLDVEAIPVGARTTAQLKTDLEPLNTNTEVGDPGGAVAGTITGVMACPN